MNSGQSPWHAAKRVVRPRCAAPRSPGDQPELICDCKNGGGVMSIGRVLGRRVVGIGHRLASGLALTAMATLVLCACTPTKAPSPSVADGGPVVAGRPAAGPVALAPAITTRPLPPPAPPTASAPPTVSAVVTARVASAPPIAAQLPPVPQTAAAATVPVRTVAAPAGAPLAPGVSCPQGTSGVWSRDVIDQPVYVCRPVER